MIYEIKDKKIKKLLEQKKGLFDKVQVINKVLFEKDKERKKLTYKMQRIKEKIAPIIKKYQKDGTITVNPPLEILTRVSLSKDGFIEVEVADQVESYKEMLLKNYEESKKSKK